MNRTINIDGITYTAQDHKDGPWRIVIAQRGWVFAGVRPSREGDNR